MGPTRGKRLVIAVLDGAVHKWRVFIEHVLHPKRDRRVIQPGAPSAGIVLSRGNGHEVFLLAVLHLHILTAILGETRHLRRSGRWQVERVDCD